MAGCGVAVLKQEKEPPVVYVLSLPATALPAVVSRLEAAVPRRARSSLSRAVPSGWWAYKAAPPVAALVGVATHAPAMNREEEEEEVRSPISSSSSRLQRPRVAVAPAAAAAAGERARRCVRCDAVETPQWRSGPTGRSTLCNACGVRYRAVAALLGHRPAAPPAPPVAEARPAVSSSSSSPPDSPIWEPRHQPPPPDIYLVRKPPPPKKEQEKEKEKEELKLKSKSKSEKKKKKRKRAGPSPAPWRNKRKHSCLHCGSSETPQWREGPAGRGTLCNACGVRYRQGRLLPEYRPKGSPTFSEAEHAFNHRKVLKLHRHHKDKPQQQPQSQTVHQPNDREQPVHDAPQEQPNVAADDVTEEPSSLDSLLLDGPSAPLIVDSVNFLVS